MMCRFILTSACVIDYPLMEGDVFGVT